MPWQSVSMPVLVAISLLPHPSNLCLPPENVIETITAAADVHLQVMERKKLMRPRKTDSVTGANQDGNLAIGELVQKLIMLYPIAIDTYDRFS